MKSGLSTLSLSALLATSLLAGVPAMAQDAPAAAEEDNSGDIIVSARRRDETLLEVPIAVSAFSGESMEQQGTQNITDLQYKAPNLTLQIARGSNSTLIAFIRGVGQQDPLWGFEPGVGLYVDDVYIARPQGAVLDIFDVERVEVLRGPQGTLYGRNTIGGAVKYVTKKLGNEFGGKVKGSYGSYNQIDLSGTITIPLGEHFAIGGGIALYKRDGFGKNLTTGAEHYNRDMWAARLSAEYDDGDIFIRLAGDRTEDSSEPRHGYRLTGSGNQPDFAPLDNFYDTRAGIGDDNMVMNQGLSLTGAFTLNDTLTLKSISAYREGESDSLIDFDNTPGPVLDVPAYYKDRQFTQEVQLLVEADRFQGVFGAFYLDAKAEGAFDTVLGFANLTTLTSGSVTTKSIAFFADGSFDLTEELKISAGLRWTKDDKTGTVFRQNFTGIRSPLFGNPNAVPGLIRSDYVNDRSFEKLTPRVSISYQPTRDLNIYASWGRGFKSGGFDMRGDVVLTPTTVNGYEPETIDSYEIGFKGAFLDRRLMLNIAAFYSDYRDQQVTVQVPNVSGGIASFVDNAGKATIKGLEIEAIARPTDNLSFNLMLGYTDAKYKEFLTYIAGGTTPVDVADQRVFQNTPKWVANVSGTWSIPVGGGSLNLTPALSLRDAYSQFEIPTALLDQPSFILVDASASWTAPGDAFSLSVHGRNLTDERYRIGGYNFPGALFGDSIIGFYGPPRTFTVTAAYRF